MVNGVFGFGNVYELGGLDLLGWNAPDGVVMLGGRAALAVGLTIPVGFTGGKVGCRVEGGDTDGTVLPPKKWWIGWQNLQESPRGQLPFFFHSKQTPTWCLSGHAVGTEHLPSLL